jgi:hypothetical protein
LLLFAHLGVQLIENVAGLLAKTSRVPVQLNTLQAEPQGSRVVAGSFLIYKTEKSLPKGLRGREWFVITVQVSERGKSRVLQASLTSQKQLW